MSVSQPPARAQRQRHSLKAERFTESVIREMTRLAIAHNAINLAQGFPEFPRSRGNQARGAGAIGRDVNQYAITWGAKSCATPSSPAFEHTQGSSVDPEREITVCCGATEAMMAAMMAVINPGDEVVIFEPFYENYGPDAILSGATPRFVRLRPPDWTFDPDELAAAFSPRDESHHPQYAEQSHRQGVHARGTRVRFAISAVRYDAFAITDEIYEHILYDGARHISLATLDGMRDRTIAINGLSKTYSVTGWRVGWCHRAAGNSQRPSARSTISSPSAPPPRCRRPAPSRSHLPESYYENLAAGYLARRDRMLGILGEAGFRCFRPRGAYYIMTDISAFGFPDDVAFARYLVEKIGVAAVPGSSFYSDPADGRTPAPLRLLQDRRNAPSRRRTARPPAPSVNFRPVRRTPLLGTVAMRVCIATGSHLDLIWT